MEKPIHIAVVASPGYTHFLPIVLFSKRLVQLYPHFHIACLIPSLGPPSPSSKTIFQTLPPNITPTFLPPVDPTHLPQGIPPAGQIQLSVTLSLPSIRKALKSLTSTTPPLVALVVDTFAVEALELAKDLNLFSYVYFPVSATTVSLHFHLPKLDQETSCEYRDLHDPIMIPGCSVPLHGKDLYTPAQDRSSQVYKLLLKRIKLFSLADGLFVNSFLEMENGPIVALSEGGSKGEYPPVYPVGPIVQTEVGSRDGNALECVEWLDRQEPCSVLFVCFGSGGTLSQEQMNELAWGLELSGHRFLWAVRPPDNVAFAGYLGGNDDVDPLEFLPSGFLERTKGRGLVVSWWAPQVEVLRHGSVGGFLSHCGWNSTMESVVNGVPLITWPLFAEQRMNAIVISEGLKTGIRPRVNENGVVERDEVAEVVRCLIEGEKGREMRERMKKLKEASTSAMKEDGSSTKILSQLVLKWKNLA
ncbi:hypothetical protein RJT34_21924 [Clitoria ternatea]|uniref:Glycosyltransferase n=1 Tax=Clitoria ternatea TaxID=43366 RepID=A0AAN9IVB6_CLITE